MIRLATLELALDQACVLLDQGLDVSEIETVAPHYGMSAGEVRLACVGRRAHRKHSETLH